MTFVRPPIKFVHQILPQFVSRDAIGNESLLIQAALKEIGIGGEIFFDERGDRHAGLPFDRFVNVAPADSSVCLYHFSVGSAIPFRLKELGQKIWARYHNITPGYFFNKPLEVGARMACNLGRRQIPIVAMLSEVILADSGYNLAEIGPYSEARLGVIPILRDYEVLLAQGKSAAGLIPKGGNRKNILFVGRICPNKAQHDLVELVAIAQKYTSLKLRLILIGGFYSDDFREAMLGFAAELGLKTSVGSQIDWTADVVVLGSISDAEMASCYRDADAFTCLSDHEGFGVPLVEAMTFELPVLAHRSSAVTETVGMAGLMVDKSNKVDLLKNLELVLNDSQVRSDLKAKGRSRAKELGLAASKQKLVSFIQGGAP